MYSLLINIRNIAHRFRYILKRIGVTLILVEEIAENLESALGALGGVESVGETTKRLNNYRKLIV